MKIQSSPRNINIHYFENGTRPTGSGDKRHPRKKPIHTPLHSFALSPFWSIVRHFSVISSYSAPRTIYGKVNIDINP